MRALVCAAKGEALKMQDIPTPQATSGSVVVKVLATSVDGDIPYILAGKTFFTFPEPFVPGPRCIGRVSASGPDTTALKTDQLVLVDPFLRARDNPDVAALLGLWDGGPAAKTWFADNWRNGVHAEYILAPLENVHALNESILCDQLKYTHAELLYLTTQMVAYGGFRGINLQPGETVVVAPATGNFSGSAISVAMAMGATVIAASRNMAQLQKIQTYFPTGRVHTVQLTNDVDTDTAALKLFGPVDAYIDLSPPQAEKTTHVRSCFNALRPYGRASLMGVLQQDVALPYVAAVLKSLTVRGQYMYEREDVVSLIRLAERGLLKLGKDIGCEVSGEFELEDFEKAIECAQQNDKYGQLTILRPNGLSPSV